MAKGKYPWKRQTGSRTLPSLHWELVGEGGVAVYQRVRKCFWLFWARAGLWWLLSRKHLAAILVGKHLGWNFQARNNLLGAGDLPGRKVHKGNQGFRKC